MPQTTARTVGQHDERCHFFNTIGPIPLRSPLPRRATPRRCRGERRKTSPLTHCRSGLAKKAIPKIAERAV